MRPEPGAVPEREERLEEAVLSYLQAVDAGHTPDPRDVLARHPDLAGELTAFFADQDQLDPLLAPLRAPPPAATAIETGPYPGPDGDSLPDHHRPAVAPPPTIPGYEVLGVLGKGGMGVVYQARHIGLDHLVALKVMLPPRRPDATLRARFRAEAQLVAKFDHPGIVRVYDCGEHEGQLYYALELVGGGGLHKAGPRTPRAAAELVAGLADAVEYAHQRGVIHRDLKPANVLLTPDGTPKITDFGLARQRDTAEIGLTQPGARIGTLPYMPREQAEGDGDAVGPASDVFGLGAILYELLTGRPPYQGRTRAAVLEQARRAEVQPPRQLNPRVPPALERICLKTLAADPARRYPSAAALAADLRRYLGRPRRWLLAGAAVAGLLLVGLTVALLLRRTDPAPAAAPPVPLTGELTVRLYTPDGTEKRGLSVDEPGALPARKGELVQVQAELNQPAYVYLLWLDGQGVVTPLYPWNDVKLEQRDLEAAPPERPPAQAVTSPTTGPAAKKKGWLLDDQDGLETVLLLARRTPLPVEVRLEDVLGKVPRARLRDPREVAVRGFDEGQPVEALSWGENRGLQKEAAVIDEPLMQLMGRLQEHFEMVRAVRFAHQGRLTQDPNARERPCE